MGPLPSAGAHAFVPLEVFDCPLEGIALVEASAGTGKTWNLCGLYLRLLLERGWAVTQILVVTFTNAATAELRDRIRQRLVQTRAALSGATETGDDPFVPQLLETLRQRGFDRPTLLRRLDAALAEFDEAAIQTIHGYCQRAAADSAFTAQLPLDSDVVRDATDLVHAVSADFWRRHVASPDASACLSAWLVARGDSPKRYAALLARHLAKPLSRVLWPRAIDPAPSPADDAMEAAYRACERLWSAQRAGVVAVIETALAGGHLKRNLYGPNPISKVLATWDEALSAGRSSAMLTADRTRMAALGQRRLTAGTRKGSPTPAHPFFEAAERVLDEAETLAGTLEIARSALLMRLVQTGPRQLQDELRRRGQITYDAMLSNLHHRLHDEDGAALATALRDRYPAALIDEFQDTDPVQFGIFDRIYRDGAGSLFLIGDPKQAIYGFRGADLHTYLGARSRAGACYTLTRNQRSTRPLIDAINALFGRNPNAFMLPGLDYPPVDAGQRARMPLVDPAHGGAALDVWLLPGTGDGRTPGTTDEARRWAAEASADEIVRLLADAQDGRVRIGQTPLRAGQIAVLVRTHSEGRLMRRTLARRRVLAIERSRQDVFHTPQAEELAHLLTAVLDPTRPGRVRTALATAPMGRTAAEVARLDEDEPAYLRFVDGLGALRRTWRTRGVGVMLRQWMRDEGVAPRLLDQDEGERALTNLLHLVEALHEAEREHPSPDALLRWLHARREDDADDDERLLRLESDENLVQIVTVHAAKGLEYPVVFCPFLWSRTDRKPDGDGIAYHDEAGQAVFDYRRDLDETFDPGRVDAALRQESAAEQLRVIYVALTRAVHRCVLVAGCHLYRRTPDDSARSLLNWMASGGGLTPQQWWASPRTPEDVRRDWDALAAACDGPISVSALPQAVGRTLPHAGDADAAPVALPPPETIPQGWRVGSYSGLVHAAQSDAGGRDHDLRVSAPAATGFDRPEVLLPEGDPIHLVGGREVGTVIHAVVEQIDFSDPRGWGAAVEDALQALPASRSTSPRGGDTVGDTPALRRARLLAMLHNVIGTPLDLGAGSPLSLCALTPQRRLVEMEFHMPADRVSGDALNAFLREHGYACPRLDFPTLNGFLRGFVDLVFEHEGRFYVLDWKSNRLGTRATDWGPEAIEAEMGRQGYHLQYLLYLVALHRMLSARLPDYDPQAHLGGAVYLFVRAVRPDWGRAGVFVHRPRAGVIERLSALIGQTQALDD